MDGEERLWTKWTKKLWTEAWTARRGRKRTHVHAKPPSRRAQWTKWTKKLWTKEWTEAWTAQRGREKYPRLPPSPQAEERSGQKRGRRNCGQKRGHKWTARRGEEVPPPAAKPPRPPQNARPSALQRVHFRPHRPRFCPPSFLSTSALQPPPFSLVHAYTRAFSGERSVELPFRGGVDGLSGFRQ